MNNFFNISQEKNNRGVFSLMEKFRISYGSHLSQFGVLRIPKESAKFPVIVTIHGGFWQSKYNLEENNPMVEDLTRRGFGTWNIEYRRVGEKGGGWPGTFNDVVDAVNHLAHLHEYDQLDTSQVTIIGHSAGGHLALWLASRNQRNEIDGVFKRLTMPIQKVISLAGVTDLKKMWNIHKEQGIDSPVETFMAGTPEEVAERYKIASPIDLLPFGLNQVLIHGELDRHVPVELSKDYYHRAMKKEDRVQLITLPEIEHFKLIDPDSEAWESVVNSL